MGDSLVARAARAAGINALVGGLSDEQIAALPWIWELWARPEQLPPPGDWNSWLILAGRGFGKSRAGAEWVRGEVEAGRAGRVALIGSTSADARDVMIEGESGILAISRPEFFPLYEPSKRRLTWPNGAIATAYSAEEPNRLRGPQHDAYWGDEPAAWHEPKAVWDMLQFGLRLGKKPRGVLTTTPRPIPFIRERLADVGTVVTRGSTYENAANLAPSFIAAIKRAYEGTRLGRQEIDAEVLDDNPGAMWSRERLDELRVHAAPQMKQIVVAIDPAVSTSATSDETGIVVAGRGIDDHAYAIEDLSGIFTPAQWAARAIDAYHRHGANYIVAEVNNGGDLVEANIRANGGANIPFRKEHASRGKTIRAEPIAALAEQGRAHTLPGLARLEDQLCAWSPLTDPHSPDRLDAYVWALTFLMLGPGTAAYKPPGAMPVRRR